VLVFAVFVAAPMAAREHKGEKPWGLCGKTVEYDDLVGVYTMTLGSSRLTAPGFPGMTRATHDVLTATLAVVGKKLTLTATNVDATLELAARDEPDWRWSDRLAGVSSKDLELVLDCGVNHFPRLVGSGSGRSAEGYPLRYTFRLIALEKGWLFGQMQWHARGMTMTRSLDLQAQSE